MEYGLVLLWLATYLALAVVALPVAAGLFPRFADRGAGLAFALSTAVLAVVGYWVGQAAFGWPALLAGLGVLVVASGLASRRGARVDWTGFADAAAVFALAFAFMVAIRSLDPAAWSGGGEKFLDFGMLASLLRASTLPPQDVWFAGEPVRYYYGGHMLAALLAKLTGTDATYAYNLALSGFYATLVATAFGLAGALGAARGYSRRVAGGSAAFFVGVASNLATPLALAFWLLPDRAQTFVLEVTGVSVKGLANGPGEFNYWFASRIIEGTINEFPFFAWLNGDMHAHMMVTGFLLLVAALLFAYWRTPARQVPRRRALVFGLVPAMAGIVAVTSTWSFPSVAGLTWLTLALAPASPVSLLPGALARRFGADPATAGERPTNRPDPTSGGGNRATPVHRLLGEAGRTALALVFAGAVAGLGVVAALPFFLGPASGRAVGLLPDRSAAGPLLVVHGAFLLVSAGYLLSRSRLSIVGRFAVAVAVAALFAVTWVATATVLAVFVPLLLGGWWLLRAGRRVGYETVLLVAVAGLVTVVEFAYVQEQAGPGRMNTVFKVYMQVWVLWGTAAGAMLAGLLDGPGVAAAVADVRAAIRWTVGRVAGRDESRGPTKTDGAGDRSPARDSGGPGGRRGNPARDGGDPPARRAAVGAVLMALLFASLSLYAGFALADEVEYGRDDPTLDARAYLAEYEPQEAAAIEWLADLEGQPHMASAPGTEIYQWVNGPSSLSGIPTVAGWAHEIGYRGREPYFDRVRDVEILFEGDHRSRAAIVRKYDVEYVYVGPIEKQRYGNPDFRGEPGFGVAFEAGNVTIYEVDRSALDGG